jgi:hypothetical protein
MNTVLSPMACLQARLDYAHHVSKKANRKGSHADDKAICIAQDAHTRLELAKAVREIDTKRVSCYGYIEEITCTELKEAVLKVMEGTK